LNFQTNRRAVALFICIGAAAILPAGCGKPGASSGSGTVGGGGAASTAGTVQTIEQRIKADKELAGANIKVQEQAGTITLDGTVASVAQKDKAEQIVLAVQKDLKQQPGVLNNLMVQESATPSGGSGSGQH
jgi:hypothetical protein